ncbi:MAG: hypothetical protein HQL01_07135 [Nitrospirae bacterium]|nr:hypothetical protein [Nitrospirota bacterium]
MMRAIVYILVLTAIAALSIGVEAGTAIYYMPFFTTEQGNPTYCWTANKSTADVTATIQIMSANSSATPSQTPLSKTLSIPAKQSKMLSFIGTAITIDNVSINISSEVGTGASTVYSADITFTSSGTLSCTKLGISCFQGTTTPRRNLVGYTCYDGTYFTF